MVHTVRSEATQPAAASACVSAPCIRSWISGLALLLSIAALLFFSGQRSAAQVVERTFSSSGVIAYATTDHEIWVVNADGSNARKLWKVPEHRRADMTGLILDPRWSKDGSKLAFTSPHEPLCSLYERNIYTVRGAARLSMWAAGNQSILSATTRCWPTFNTVSALRSIRSGGPVSDELPTPRKSPAMSAHRQSCPLW